MLVLLCCILMFYFESPRLSKMHTNNPVTNCEAKTAIKENDSSTCAPYSKTCAYYFSVQNRLLYPQYTQFCAQPRHKYLHEQL